YDPAIGRFISEDPLGFDGGDINLYQYAAANPLNNNDPSGKILPAIAAGCAAAPVACAGAVSAVSSVVFGAGVRYFSGEKTTGTSIAIDA
ncbi:RHS repeat-associated core domain-containing protein, partial [Acinetobacter baumannii]